MIKILIADDQTLIRDSLKIVLDNVEGFKVVAVAENGIEVVELVKQNPPDIILMDIRMPKMDGVQCTKVIKEQYPQIKIVILTTFDDDEYVYNALRYGASGYLLKGVSMEELVAAINTIHSGKAMINSDISAKLIKMFSKIANPDYTINVPETALPDLSDTDKKIIKLVASGASNKEISEALHLSEGTVRNYLSSILNRLELRDRTQLAIWAIQTDRLMWTNTEEALIP